MPASISSATQRRVASRADWVRWSLTASRLSRAAAVRTTRRCAGLERAGGARRQVADDLVLDREGEDHDDVIAELEGRRRVHAGHLQTGHLSLERLDLVGPGRRETPGRCRLPRRAVPPIPPAAGRAGRRIAAAGSGATAASTSAR